MRIAFYLSLFAIIGYSVYVFAAPGVDFTKDAKEGIQFNKSGWAGVLATAKKENKIIFLDIYATWCGSCKNLKKNVFSSQSIGAYFNSRFINVSFDGEKEDGEKLVKKYSVEAYPALLFINSDGTIIKKAVGFHTEAELINLGKSISE